MKGPQERKKPPEKSGPESAEKGGNLARELKVSALMGIAPPPFPGSRKLRRPLPAEPPKPPKPKKKGK